MTGVSRAGRSRRRRWLPADWPLRFTILAFPLWWALGIGAFMWILMGLAMAVQLSARRGLHVPKGFGWWLLYVFWVGVSFLGLAHENTGIFYQYRLLSFLAVTVAFVWVYNADPQVVPTRRLVGYLATMWLITVAGGWLGVLMPSGGFTSPAEKLLPHALATQAFLQALMHPSFAQVQTFLGYPVGRPKAPFPYTNNWGAVYSLTAPFFFYGWLQSTNPARRRRGLLILGASLVPVFVSLNRGLWLGLGAALLNAATRSGDVARAARRILLALVTLGVLVLVFTPLSAVVAQRAQTGHSNEGRFFLYTESFASAAQSPIIGHGGPVKVTSNKLLPDIGTQGQFWNVLVSQGYVGLLFFEAFFVKMWFATRQRGRPVTFWAHATVTVVLVVQFVYDLLPAELPLVFLALGVGLRDAHRVDGAEPEGLREAPGLDPELAHKGGRQLEQAGGGRSAARRRAQLLEEQRQH